MAIICYEHHGNVVFVDAEQQGKHREVCLCYRCLEFKPNTPENCPVSEEVYTLCVQEALVLPVWECPNFIPR